MSATTETPWVPSSINKVKVSQMLTAGNFREWQREVKNQIAVAGVRTILDEDGPSSDNKIRETQYQVAAWIELSISENLKHYVSEEAEKPNPKGMLDVLAKKLDVNTSASRIATLNSLLSLEIREGENIPEFATRAASAADRFNKASTGMKLEELREELLLLAVLNGTKNRFPEIVVSLKQKQQLDVHIAITQLMAGEDEEDSAKANAARATPKLGGSRSCTH